MESWSFIQNPFLTATDSSMRKSVRIAQLHLAALQAYSTDLEIQIMRDYFAPFSNDLNDDFDAWFAHNGSQEGDTLTVTQQLRLLRNPKIRQWDVRIQAVYAEDTAKYKSLLPNGRGPFQTGGQLLRINAVKSLGIAMGTDAALATLKAEVNLFYDQVNAAYGTQQSSISTTKGLSDAVENARVAMCVAMYSNLGKLMSMFAATPGEITKFFPLELIRKAQQVDFTRTVNPLTIRFIVQRTLAATDSVRLINDGNTDLLFYLAPNKTAAHGSTFVTVHAHTEQTVEAAALGDLANAFILCYNPDTHQQGHLTLELM